MIHALVEVVKNIKNAVVKISKIEKELAYASSFSILKIIIYRHNVHDNVK